MSDNRVVGIGGGAIGAEYYRSGDDQFAGTTLTSSAGIAIIPYYGSATEFDGSPIFQAFLSGSHGGKSGSLEKNWSGTVGGKTGYAFHAQLLPVYVNLVGGFRFNSSPLLKPRTPQVGMEAGFTGLVSIPPLIIPGLRLMVSANPSDFSDVVIAGGLGGGW